MGQLLHLFWKSYKNALRSPAWTVFEVILPVLSLALIILGKHESLDVLKMPSGYNGMNACTFASQPSNDSCYETAIGKVNANTTRNQRDYCGVNVNRSSSTATFIIHEEEKREKQFRKESNAVLSFFPGNVPFQAEISYFMPLFLQNQNITMFFANLNRRTRSFKIPKNVLLAPNLGEFSLFLCTFVPIICSIHVARDIAMERESMVKDYLVAMGMSRTYYYFHHYAFAMLKSMIAVIAQTGLFFMDPDTTLLAISFFPAFTLFVSAFIAIGLCIGALIKRPSLATLSCMLATFGLAFLATMWHATRTEMVLSILSYVSPTHAMFGILDELTEAWCRGGGINYIEDLKTMAGYLEALAMLALTNVLFFGLAILFDFLSSSTDSFWGIIATKFGIGRRKHKGEEEEAVQIADAIENDSLLDKLPVDIHLVDVHKTWGNGEYAVRGIDLKVYRGQVTILLGHNGAGKSTSFAMISGMVVPSKGTMRIGEDFVKEGEMAKTASIGFCPQYNPMFPKLTVLENLQFFAKLKGENQYWEEDRTRLVNTLQLTEHADVQARRLSGGQKRKLCVAMALIGGSRVILLDEPTAGMDTGARRDMERLLAEYKSEKTFLMTTHYTDEEENLGDRIVIMAQGKVVCSGSPTFLNKRFEAGYVLSAVTTAGTNIKDTSAALLNHVQIVVPASKLQRQHGQQIEIWMPKDETPKFAELFRTLEATGAELGIGSFGLSLNTLEQVFLKVGELTGTKNREQEVRAAIDNLLEQNENRAGSKFLKRFGAGFYKRALYDKVIKTASVTKWYERNRWQRPVIAAGVEFVQDSGCKDPKPNSNNTHLLVSFADNLRNAYSVLAVVYRAITQKKLTFDTLEVKQKDEPDPFIRNGMGHRSPSMQLFAIILLTIPIMSFRIAGFYIIDRTSKFAHQQMLTGMSQVTYWLAGFAWDSVVFMVQGSFIAATMFALEVVDGDDSELRTRFLLMLPLCCVVLALRSYLASLLLDSKAKTETLMLLTLLFGQLVCMVCMFSRFMDPTSSAAWFKYGWIDPATPLYIPMIERMLSDDISLGTNYGIGVLMIQIALHLGLIALKLNLKSCFSGPKEEPEESGREKIRVADVDVEKKAIQQGNQQDLFLEVNSLLKWYGKKNCAVRGISFGVHAHECFGLLGTNGAGKTSTFEILTGNAIASAGSALVAGVNCAKMATIGYCPQFDALMPDLTGYQCLRILAAMHGYADPGRVADLIVECVGMSDHADKKTKSYSGGQRRKISVGVALLAQNSLIILDEPTAGIDPVARRDIWTVLVALRDHTQTAIVLTSHSMDEVEALCSRVAIMKRGRIVALGSAQALKTKYGDHYKLAIVLQKLEPLDKVTPIVQSHFPKARLIPGAATKTIHFEIPREPNQKWSELFDAATEAANELRTTDYCLSQASLEDAFVAITVDSQPTNGEDEGTQSKAASASSTDKLLSNGNSGKGESAAN